MTFQEFMFHILQMMQEEMEGETEVSLREIVKNNGVMLNGLTFTKKEINISPTIYLEEFYREYKDGKTMDEIIEEIREIYYTGKPEHDVDMDFFTEYRRAKERIVYKLVNYEKNKEFLEHIPHRKFLDLAIVYYYLVDMKEFANATILIHNKHLECWEVGEEELYTHAKINTPALLKVNFCGMMEVLKEISEEDFFLEDFDKNEPDCVLNGENGYLLEMHVKKDETGMYVLSNFSRMYGATAILYEGVLETCAKQLNANLYILPSSVHEVILIPDEGQVTKEKLEQMVKEVNETQVEAQELLSDFVYYYSVETRGIVRL